MIFEHRAKVLQDFNFCPASRGHRRSPRDESETGPFVERTRVAAWRTLGATTFLHVLRGSRPRSKYSADAIASMIGHYLDSMEVPLITWATQFKNNCLSIRLHVILTSSKFYRARRQCVSSSVGSVTRCRFWLDRCTPARLFYHPASLGSHSHMRLRSITTR